MINMDELRLRKAYLKVIDQAYRCVRELAEIRTASATLKLLELKKTRKVFESRDAQRLRRVFRNAILCQIIIRVYAICFNTGQQKDELTHEEWLQIVEQHPGAGKNLVFSNIVFFLSRESQENEFILNLASANNVFAEYAKKHAEELRAAGIAGGRLPRFKHRQKLRATKLCRRLERWRNLKNNPLFGRFCVLRHKAFAHNPILDAEWVKQNDLRPADVTKFVDDVWDLAREILNLLIYGVVSKNPAPLPLELDRLLLVTTPRTKATVGK